jgi:hypothetical protein
MEADQLKALSNMPFSLLVTPSGASLLVYNFIKTLVLLTSTLTFE